MKHNKLVLTQSSLIY